MIVLHAATGLKKPTGTELLITKDDGFVPGSAIHTLVKVTSSLDDQELTRRQQQKDVCYLGWVDHNVVHYSWLSPSLLRSSEVDYCVPLPPRHYWIYNAYTDPAYRGKGIFPRVIAQMAEDCYRAGATHVWMGIVTENNASLQGALKAGFKEAAGLERTTWLSFFTRIQAVPLDAALFDAMPRALCEPRTKGGIEKATPF